MPGEDITTLTLDQCKGKQKLIREKITSCCTRIRRVISNKQSRREAEKLLNEARAHLGETGPLNDRIIELLNEEDGVTPHDQFLRYSGAVDGLADEVTDYLASRADDLPSTNGDPPSHARVDAEQRQKEAQEAFEAAKKVLKEADETLAAVEVSTSAPDDWIEIYCAGKEKPAALMGDHRHSSASGRKVSARSGSQSSLSELEYTLTGSKSDTHFRPDMEIIRECEERSKEEITRLIAAMATWQKKNPKQKVPANFLKNNQTYTISAFISEVMKSGFDAKYLSGRKLTNQVAKHGRNIKEPLHPDDVHAVIALVFRAWKKLPLLSKKKDSQSELYRIIRLTIRTYLSNKRVGNILK
ncbi:hypothetical protein DAPPUDRAFT_229858 [Daphnia pulex]|uniref:BEN domain-containing protein n=1 Tax=Daphnia pulex TaxID=6669 RepID=E9HVT8_DAPPU|nr:hypothetical protein DAPPUDRAFT_229858 [Daphnia pulex]|eukprot:EFX64144.1 hypothetical protein DAPPUDRAFT_229858 [Daphnia pulex]